MELTRRRALRSAGASVSVAALAGCLSSAGPGADDGIERVDAPPYEVDEPTCDPPEDGRDPLWLCEGMVAEPSLDFEQAATTLSMLAGEGLQREHGGGDRQFYATLLTDADDADLIAPDGDAAPVELIDGTDFDDEAVLVAQTGWGSGSFTPHLKRIEATDDGVHAFGCYRRPCVWTDDYTVRTVVARFERPDAIESGVVSLVVDPETRVTFAVDDGVVTVSNEA